MSANAPKPLSTYPNGNISNRRAATDGSNAKLPAGRPTANPPTTSSLPPGSTAPHQASTLTRTSSLQHSPLPVSARAAARRPGGSRSSASFGKLSSMAGIEADDDMRAENIQLVEDLKMQLQRAELASEEYQKQLNVLQMRLDEVMKEQMRMEEKEHDRENEVLDLQAEMRDTTRRRRDLEQSHEAERALMLKERDQQAAKEEELQSVIQRLNETIRQRELRTYFENERPTISRSGSFRNRGSPDLDGGQFAPSTQLDRSPSRNNSKLLLQKDKMIEGLRLELAEVQIKLAEMEHMGDGKLQELEKSLLETRMANARLMEDNESFQLLLSEKTLKGDFMNDSRVSDRVPGTGSLADELEFAGDETESESDAYRKLEGEVKSLRDGNKALTLYIDKIIGRLLQHEGFEHIIHDQDEPPQPPAKAAVPEKALPAPPPQATPSLLQRARSVVGGPGGRPSPRLRPISHMPTPTAERGPTAHNNPQTAPSIPIARGHRRVRSDQAQQDAAAATVVGQMYPAPPLRTPSGGPMSPGLRPAMNSNLTANRVPFFHPGNPTGSRAPSGSGLSGSGLSTERDSGSNSVTSEHSGEIHSTDTPSPPHTVQNANVIPGAVMKQNQLRPLRLVREQEDDEAARKKANRGSWMGWFNRGSGEEAPTKPG